MNMAQYYARFDYWFRVHRPSALVGLAEVEQAYSDWLADNQYI